MRLVFIKAALIIAAVLFLSGCSSLETAIQQPTTTNQTITVQPSSPQKQSPLTPSPSPSTIASTPAGELQVHFIDVGQGDAILIDYGNQELLIDGSDRSPGIANSISLIVDGDLEVMVATHPHADHIGGLIDVLGKYEVNEIWHNGDTDLTPGLAHL